MIPFILNKFVNNVQEIKKILNKTISFIKKLIIYIMVVGLIFLFSNYLDSLTTKEILIGFIVVVVCYLLNDKRGKVKEESFFKNSSLDKNKFNDAIAREILSIKFRLDELLDDKNACFKKSKHTGSEYCRKEFTQLWRAYRGYEDIVSFKCYDTPDGKEGAMIILLQKYYAGLGHEGKDVYYYFDPLGEIEEFNEEKLIQLHSYGPKEYKHIEKLKEGDIIKAYIYDPEEFGLLKPHESEIKVISIEEDKYDSDRNITLEIIEQHWDDDIFNRKREPVIRTLKYVNL